MKFFTIKDLRTAPASIWKDLSTEREFIITSSGKPFALITPLNDATLENTVSAVRRAKAVMAVQKMQNISASLGNNKMSFDEIYAIVKDVRRNKK
jgi:antitoxin (DNA-binding transcriptional repressor) of toxin-antitoxin stability system